MIIAYARPDSRWRITIPKAVRDYFHLTDPLKTKIVYSWNEKRKTLIMRFVKLKRARK